VSPTTGSPTTGIPTTGGPGSGGTSGVREWLGVEDPAERRTWLFDVAFLLSGWHCLFGCGCQGVLTAPTPERGEGCCSYGAHLSDRHDAARVEAAAAEIPPALWQHHRQAWRHGRLQVLRRAPGGGSMTRQVAGACIFLNRPGFPGGSGCALHLSALARGVAPRTTKPEVCWQLPLRREDLRHEDGSVTTLIRRWERRDWGEGGAAFAWWCTEAPEALGGRTPLYRALAEDLQAMVGPEIYRRLADALDARIRRRPRRRSLSAT
jgi:hypothetical protein